jgi:hypothetical protein
MAAVYAPQRPVNSPPRAFAMEPASVLGFVAPPVADTTDVAPVRLGALRGGFPHLGRRFRLGHWRRGFAWRHRM